MTPNSNRSSQRPVRPHAAERDSSRRGRTGTPGPLFSLSGSAFFWGSAWAIWIAIGVALGLLAASATESQAEPALIDGIAAQVGTEIVLVSEVQELGAPMEERMRAQGVPETQIRSMYRDALERLIESKLIEGVVKRLELDATDQEIDNAIYGIAQDNGLTIEQLQSSVRSHGLSVTEYREKIRGEIERSKVLNAMVRSRVRVEPEEVQELFDKRFGDQRAEGEEVYLRHILVGAGPSAVRDVDTACVIAQEARDKIAGGEIAFGDMAQRVTDMNPEKQGELGWLHVADMASWMSTPLEGMQPGDVSEVIPTAFGCNVIQLVERRGYEPVTLAAAEESLTAELTRQKTDSAYLEWLETLRAQTYVARHGAFNEAVRIEQIAGPRE